MKVLLDVGVSPRLRPVLSDALDGAVVESAVFHDWRELRNGELLRRARQHGFTTLVTADKRLAQEQAPLPLAIVTSDAASQPTAHGAKKHWQPARAWRKVHIQAAGFGCRLAQYGNTGLGGQTHGKREDTRRVAG